MKTQVKRQKFVLTQAALSRVMAALVALATFTVQIPNRARMDGN